MPGPAGRAAAAPCARDFARRLRRDGTDAERRLWRALRDRRLAGAKFRRQQPVGGYVLDFVCFAARLVVEVDGGQHAAGARADADRRRDAVLRDAGYRVLRFWNTDVLADTEGVLAMIEAALHEASPPSRR